MSSSLSRRKLIASTGAAFLGYGFGLGRTSPVQPRRTAWKVQCIDTMKTSRDPVREPFDEARKALIQEELALIRSVGANYVAIDTPYDAEFIPQLRYWVESARKHGLNVWFRGNWCSWEGWYDYPKWMTTYDKHIYTTVDFIRGHPDLFADGDSFCLCPEPENSPVLHDPRAKNGHSDLFKKYLRDAYDAMTSCFATQRKRVAINWFSVNGDIGREILDKRTVNHIGGLVTIDHYVPSVAKMIEYVDSIHEKFGCKVLIGEFGAPLINVNPRDWSEQRQAEFIHEILEALWMRRSFVHGINYWVGAPGSPSDTTCLFNRSGPGYEKREAARVVEQFFTRSD